MEPVMIGVKQLYRELPQIAEKVRHGRSFIVVKHAKPIFRIEPVRKTSDKKYTLADFKKISFTSKDKDLSKHIDQIVYGV